MPSGGPRCFSKRRMNGAPASPPSTSVILAVAAAACVLFYAAGQGLLASLHVIKPMAPGADARWWILLFSTMTLDACEAAVAFWAMRKLAVGSDIFGMQGWVKAAAFGLAVGVAARFALKPQIALASLPLDGFAANPYRALSTMAIGPAIETFLHCGVVYTALRRRHGTAAATLIAAVVFGFSEFALRYPGGGLSENAQFLGAKLVLGLVFTGPYALTGSLWSPFLAHAAYNF